ncbi:hypothetical protein MMC18_000666 [Xylographa bjoerkii]|nr:hypothetical protein [Xylographa bjoerkii]
MSGVSPSQLETSAPDRKPTAGPDPVQSSNIQFPEKVFLVRFEDEGQGDPQALQEILGVYASVENANAAAHDYWEQYYGWIDEDPRAVEEGDQPPDGEDFLYKGMRKDGTMHILSVDAIGLKTAVIVECMPLL